MTASGTSGPGHGRSVLFLSRDLVSGGAERQLRVLAAGLAGKGHSVTVCTFYPAPCMQGELEDQGVRVINLEKRSRWDLVGFSLRLARAVRVSRAEVLHGYLPVPNLLVSLLRPVARGARILWGIRASDMQLHHYDWASRVSFALCRWLAPTADLIVVNSEAGREFHAGTGYPRDRMVVVLNGIDTERFHRSRDLGAPLREAWGVRPDEALVGVVARLDPMKGHIDFLKSLAAVRRTRPGVRAVFVGEGPAKFVAGVKRSAAEMALSDGLIWAGARRDMVAVYNALDVLCSPSVFGEGFSNVIGEAMACGVPCAVTDVGDAAMVVGGTGVVVRPGDADAMAEAVIHLLAEGREARAAARRDRVATAFTVGAMVRRMEGLLWPS